jgi:hypothetical protein
MKMSLREMTYQALAGFQDGRANSCMYIFVLQVLQQLQFAVRSFRQDRRAEGLHDLLDCDILAGKLIFGRTVVRISISNCSASSRCRVRIFRTKLDQKLPFQLVGGRNICAIVSVFAAKQVAYTPRTSK